MAFRVNLCGTLARRLGGTNIASQKEAPWQLTRL